MRLNLPDPEVFLVVFLEKMKLCKSAVRGTMWSNRPGPKFCFSNKIENIVNLGIMIISVFVVRP